MVATSAIEAIDPSVAARTASIWPLISRVALAVWVAEHLHLAGNDLEPLARLAGACHLAIVAFSASRLVWLAMSLMSRAASPMREVASARPFHSGLSWRRPARPPPRPPATPKRPGARSRPRSAVICSMAAPPPRPNSAVKPSPSLCERWHWPSRAAGDLADIAVAAPPASPRPKGASEAITPETEMREGACGGPSRACLRRSADSACFVVWMSTSEPQARPEMPCVFLDNAAGGAEPAKRSRASSARR